jgi:GntR family transcriptional regulator
MPAHSPAYSGKPKHPRANGGSARGAQTWTRRVHDLLRSEIRSGELPQGAILVEDRLMQSLAASRTSVREALQQLAISGLVTRVPRGGTRVVDRITQVSLTDILPHEYQCDFKVLIIDRRIVPATDLIRARLGVDDDQVGFVEHFFVSGEEPVGVRAVYHRANVVQPAGWQQCPSLGEAFEFVFGRPLGGIESTIDAVPADQKTADLLGVVVGSPVLLVEQSLYDADGVCQEFTFTRYRANRVSLTSLVAMPTAGSLNH